MKSYGLRRRQDQRPIAKSSALTAAVRCGAGGCFSFQILFDLAIKAGNHRAIFPEGAQAVAASLAGGLEQGRPV